MISAFLVLVIVLSTQTPLFALSENQKNDEENVKATYQRLFKDAGVSINDDAVFMLSIAENDTGEKTTVLQAIETFGSSTKVTFLVSYLEDEYGNIQFIDPLNEGETRGSGGGTKGTVTASAYWNSATIAGNTTYRPYKLETVTTGTTKILVEYLTNGHAYTSSGTYVGIYGYSIDIEKNPPIANHMYSTTSYAPYYYYTIFAHRIRIVIGNGAEQYIRLVGDPMPYFN